VIVYRTGTVDNRHIAAKSWLILLDTTVAAEHSHINNKIFVY